MRVGGTKVQLGGSLSGKSHNWHKPFQSLNKRLLGVTQVHTGSLGSTVSDRKKKWQLENNHSHLSVEGLWGIFCSFSRPFPTPQNRRVSYYIQKRCCSSGRSAFGFGCKFRLVPAHLLFILEKKDTY